MANYPNSSYMQQMTPQQSQQMLHPMYSNASMQQMQMHQMIMSDTGQGQLSAQQQMMMNSQNRLMQMQQISPEQQQMMIRARQQENQRLMTIRPIPRSRYPSQISQHQHNLALSKMREIYPPKQPQQSQQQPQQQQQQQMFYHPQRIMNSSTMRPPMAVHGTHGRQENVNHSQMVSMPSDMNVQYITASPQTGQGISANYNSVRQVSYTQGSGTQQNVGQRPIVYQVKGALPHGVRSEIPSNSVLYNNTSGSSEGVLVQNSQMGSEPSTTPSRPQPRAPTTLMMALSQPQQMTAQTVLIESTASTVSTTDLNAPGPSTAGLRLVTPPRKTTPPQSSSTEKPTGSRSAKKVNPKSKAKSSVTQPLPKSVEPASLLAKAPALIDRNEMDRIVKEMGLEGKIDVIPYKLIIEYAETYAQLAVDDLAFMLKCRQYAPDERPVIRERDANFVVKKLRARYAHL